MKQKKFIEQVVNKVQNDWNVVGLAAAGSFITGEIDEFSDVDLVLVTRNKISDDLPKMESYARSFGDYLNGFTGEHVGERRVLICLYDNPLLHVDIKFLTLDEFRVRIENPVVFFDRDNALETIISTTKAEWPTLDYQWIEDRFWTWVHYATLKLGRGENFEALDFLSFIRTSVISPMFQIKNKRLPRGLRKVEMNFNQIDIGKLVSTVPSYESNSLFTALDNTISLFLELRERLFPATIILRVDTQERTLEYLREIKRLKLG